MIEFTWIQEIAPILIFVIAWIFIFGATKRLGIIGSPFVLSLLSMFISLLLISVTASVEFAMEVIAYSATIFVTGFFLILAVAFVAKSPFNFTRPLAWIFFALVSIMVVFLAFDHFPAFFHMMPGTSSSHLASSTREIKSFIYSKEVVQNFVFAVCALIVGFVIVKK